MQFEHLVARYEDIFKAPAELQHTRPIGKSREQRDIHGFHVGSGPTHISVIAGCHADEPVGPLLLTKFGNYVQTLSPDDPLLTDYAWWIIPHANPDGKAVNDRWWDAAQQAAGRQVVAQDIVDLIAYLRYRVRELPGDDMEFGFPKAPDEPGIRPENTHIYRWWRSFNTSFHLHASLHGMGFAAGPWYLIEEAWQHKIEFLKTECLRFVEQHGYRPHDVDRQGEKGFFRLGQGFCTRPDSKYMRQYFLQQGDADTAALFYPSSMEIMRSFGGDPLTVVSEMPLFLLPDVGIEIGPPDEAAVRWKERLATWQIFSNKPKRIRQEQQRYGITAMPVLDQMRFQWHFMCCALEQVRLARET
jgi:hypothetical protein